MAGYRREGYSVNARNFYIKPLSDEPDCEIGLVNGKTSALIKYDDFAKTNGIDTFDNARAWVNRDNDNTLDKLLESIKKYVHDEEEPSATKIQMRNSFKDAIHSYIKACNQTSWIAEEAYKFEFANFTHSNVNWEQQTDSEILDIFLKSQKTQYAGISRGIQFIQKSGRETLRKFIDISDVELFRTIYQGDEIATLNWDKRSMSYTVLSAWLATLFPAKFFPVPTSGFDKTINYLFDTNISKFPKKGLRYITESVEYY